MSANKSNNDFVEDLRDLREKHESAEHDRIIKELELAEINDEIKTIIKQAKRRHSKFFSAALRNRAAAGGVLRMIVAAHTVKVVAILVIVAVVGVMW